MIYKSTVDLYVDAPDAHAADAMIESIMRTARYDLLDWARAGNPIPATKRESGRTA